MMKLKWTILWLVTLLSTGYGQYDRCLTGLAVYNRTNHLILPLDSCNQTVSANVFHDPPTVTFTRAKSNETYILMLLQSTRSPDIFILHWLLSELKAVGLTLLTSSQSGTRDLISGYFAPVNETQYELRLYNSTGNMVWEHLSTSERNDFFPSQWLAKNRVFSAPVAKTIFTIRTMIPGPPGWIVPHNPLVQPMPQFPSLPGHTNVQQPVQYPPNQGSYPPPPTGQSQLPPVQVQAPNLPGHFQTQYPHGQIPSQYPQNQLTPQYPSGQVPQLPQNQIPPQYPSVQVPQLPPNQYPPQHPSIPHPPQYLPHYPTSSSNIPVKQDLNINGTLYYVQNPDKPALSPLFINSTLYSSNTYNKYFKLTPYLIIDHRTYSWRNMTRVPGSGQVFYINGTLYVPYNPSTHEIHHHYYKKGAASVMNSFSLFSVFLIPTIISIYNHFI